MAFVTHNGLRLFKGQISDSEYTPYILWFAFKPESYYNATRVLDRYHKDLGINWSSSSDKTTLYLPPAYQVEKEIPTLDETLRQDLAKAQQRVTDYRKKYEDAVAEVARISFRIEHLDEEQHR